MSAMTVDAAFKQLAKDLKAWKPEQRSEFVSKVLAEFCHECAGCHRTLIPLSVSMCADCQSFQADVRDRYHS